MNYESVYHTLPPAYLTDAEGKPMHSWRVLILPYLEQKGALRSIRFQRSLEWSAQQPVGRKDRRRLQLSQWQ